MDYKTKAEAVKAGRKLLKRMPRGWKLQVCENMGWHVCVHYKKFISVYECHYKQPMTYHCLLGHEFAGRPGWTTDGSSTDPMRVVRASVKAATVDVKQLQRILNICQESVKEQHG